MVVIQPRPSFLTSSVSVYFFPCCTLVSLGEIFPSNVNAIGVASVRSVIIAVPGEAVVVNFAAIVPHAFEKFRTLNKTSSTPRVW